MDVTGLLEEVSILAHLRHPHVTAFVDFVEDAWYYYVVLELVRGGELFDRISKKVRFWIRARLGLFVSWSCLCCRGLTMSQPHGPQTTYTELEARNLFKTLVGTIGYLHSCNVVHRDIKVRACVTGWV